MSLSPCLSSVSLSLSAWLPVYLHDCGVCTTSDAAGGGSGRWADRDLDADSDGEWRRDSRPAKASTKREYTIRIMFIFTHIALYI